MFLLHAHAGEGAIFSFLEEVLLHGLLDTLKIIPFLFLTYLLMEYIEHRSSERAEQFMKKAGVFGPAVGGALGVLPQCGFSAAAAGLYSGRVISVGTLLAIFLSTSDEMLPILISGDFGVGRAALLVLYKLIVGIIVGFLVDLILRLMRRGEREINIDNICENDNCHCERGILHSALHHTVTITLFVLAITVAINTVVFFVGTDVIAEAVLRYRDGVDAVIGSRRLSGDGYEGYTPLRKMASIAYFGVLKAVGGFDLSDSQCGFKSFRGDLGRKIFGKCQTNGFAFDFEVLLLAEKCRAHIEEMPVTIINHRQSTVHLVRDSFRMMRDLLRIKKRVRRVTFDS